MKRLSSARGYTMRINRYFDLIKGKFHMELLPNTALKEKGKLTYQKIWDTEPEPPTLSGLALFLGFNSRNEFEAYERGGEFANHVKRARLRIEAEYEKKLHYQSSTGAIFMLKSLGWAEKPDGTLLTDIPKTMKIEIVNPGLKLAVNENEVMLN
ncbi:hypothetical protein EWM62_03805 [Mucilaginibacter terrigena]|uniref:Uncharacterized protein n=1 Tax=Mucilaginibacter terrigena TaxID=2492395 RepID=A0A4Q5LNX6_9SPHI|nr:terminase small subunit [Mucilaginibacter terrigena]RYU91072.1 hypothetical protein EWM62_03805 [Mucilaginibacter terrigena]